MPVSLSYPKDETMNKSLKILVSRSISFAHSARSILRSVSFRGRDADNDSNLKSLGSRKLMIKGSLSFNNTGQKQPFHFETTVSVVSPRADEKDRQKGSDESCRISRPAAPPNEPPQSPLAGVGSPKHEAAVTLQKVYRSFRTRRQLADCAILVEQQWWRLIDFALLKRSSVSFFNLQKQETAVSRWWRARTRAAKVGKGLSKDEKAQKLALQHWLEAIDPRHRYGHNLHFYYDHWLKCESKQPFFYWLDVGEGKEINLQEKCSRQKLQQQCIMYLGPRERETYQVIVEEGRFIYKNSGEILHTCDGSKNEKWIFVLSTSKILYVGQKKKGNFQHSSFLAGGATSAAGRLVIETGILKAVWPHSGHYRPTNANFQEFMSFLQGNGVDLTDVRKIPVEGEEDTCGGLITSSSELDLSAGGNNASEKQLLHASAEKLNFGREMANALNPVKLSRSEEKQVHEETNSIMEESNCSTDPNEVVNFALEDSSISEQMFSPRKRNIFQEDQDKDEESSLPSELIRRRINSKKGLESYQLGKKLTFKWADGMGPRIACVRDYPSELQFRALEQVSLSPRSPSKLPLVSPGIEGCRKLSNLSS